MDLLDRIMAMSKEDMREAVNSMLGYIKQIESHNIWLEDQFSTLQEASSFAKMYTEQTRKAGAEYRKLVVFK